MTRLEELTRKLIVRLEGPLLWAKNDLENDYPPEELFDISLYKDLIQSQNLIKELEVELNKLSEKDLIIGKFKQKKLF